MSASLPNLVYAEILTSGCDALEPCVLVSVERRQQWGEATKVVRRYLFGAPEELVRFCGSHQVKLGQLAGVFVLGGAGGLPELLLAAAEQAIPQLRVRGPAGIETYVKALTETLVHPGATSLDVQAARPEAGACYQDEFLEVWAVDPGDVAAAGAQPPEKRRRVENGTATSVAYRCCLRGDGGGELVILPPGCPAVMGEGRSDDVGGFVLHLGPRPSGATSLNEIGVCSDGRQRGLWKSNKILSKWRVLCPEVLLPPDPCRDGVDASKQALSAPREGGPVLRLYLWPKAQLESGKEEVQDDEVLRQQVLKDTAAWGLEDALLTARRPLLQRHRAEGPGSAAVESSSTSASSSSGAKGPDGPESKAPVSCEGSRSRGLEVLFLGTGSAKPTSRRGQSAILLRLAPGSGRAGRPFSALLDCGGGTWAQLSRLLGDAAAKEIVNKLDLVWISHHHADHCAGLPLLLAKRTEPGLVLIASDRVQRFWHASRSFARGSVNPGLLRTATPKDFRPPAELEGWWPQIRSVPVVHCPQSYGLVLRASGHLPEGDDRFVQFVYSGDCRPSDSLVAAATEGAETVESTWLVHEATFDEQEMADAEAKRHSTVAEALTVARRMKATGVLLTHFSQRYPSISGNDSAPQRPSVEKEAKEMVGELPTLTAGAAFDGLCLTCEQFGGFAAARPMLEEFWAKEHERSEHWRRHEMPELRQPLPGALFPGKLFRSAASSLPAADTADAASLKPLMRGRLLGWLCPGGPDCCEPRPSTDAENAGSNAAEAGNRLAARTDSPPVAMETHDLGRGTLEERLRTFYQRLNPEKLGDASKLARLFAGKEGLLNDKLRARYDGEDLQSQGLERKVASSSSSDDDDDDDGKQLHGRVKSSKAPVPGVRDRSFPPPPLPPPPPPPPRPATLLTTLAVCSEAVARLPAAPSPRPVGAAKPSERQGASRARPGQMLPKAAEERKAAEEPKGREEHEASGSEDSDESAPPSPDAVRRQKEAAIERLEARLLKFYALRNPEKASDAPKVARTFVGKEDELNAKLRARYRGADLSSPAGFMT